MTTWTAQWIAPEEVGDDPGCQRPAYQLGGALTIDGDVVGAELRATAHGVYEAFVNGARVGDDELTPGWTSYHHRLQVQTYDVGHVLRGGENVVGVLLSDGWWRGQNTAARRTDCYGTTTALFLELHVTLANGGRVVFGTDDSWRSTPSHVLGADLVAGEVHDLRRRVSWDTWAQWAPVRVEDHGTDRFVTSPAPPVRRIEELRPRSVSEIADGTFVVDLGQNINGWVRLGQLGPAGTEVTLTYGEWLDADGDVTQDHVAHVPVLDQHPDVTFQVDRVVSAGIDGDVFEPRHSTKGFQFVRVEGFPGELTADHVTGVVVHTALERVGGFECSDERINRLHDAAVWSFRGNACDIPTDCPTRERAGWTGDWQLYVETASYLYDVHGFSAKWLRDLAADQHPDGKVTNLVPAAGSSDPGSISGQLEGSAGWGDAAVHVPWALYLASGDSAILEEQWDSAKAWVDFAARAAAELRHASRVERSAEPAAHEQYLWDSGFHFGEWLEAGEDLSAAYSALFQMNDHGAVATAYLARSAQELADIARVLGHHADVEHYSALAAGARDAWRIEFLGADGRITPATQATYARALAFGLVPEELRAVVADHLVELVRAAGNHLSTGFLTTPFLLPALADTGHLDVAYDLLFQDTEPSWLTMIDRGATTVWEDWGGVDADGAPHASLNHYSKGAVVTFLHQYVAGVKALEPGHRRFSVRPMPGGGITSARTHHDTPFGRIDVAWSRDGESGSIEVTVPNGTAAELELPDGSSEALGTGSHHRSWHHRPREEG